MKQLLVLVMVAGCISPVMKFGEGKTAKQAQHDTMGELTPGRLVTDAKWNGEVATRKVRVWADNQYRTQNIKWQQTFESTLELANLVLEPLFGLRLVSEYQVWDRHVPGTRLLEDLEALAARDPGSDVFAVIGLTSSLPLVSSTFEELGIANLNGRHVIVRGYADLEERKLYADVFRDLLPEERELALEQRRQHKTAVVLIHELGHSLGVDHEETDDLIMSASYSHLATKLGPRAEALMLRGVDARLGRGGAKPDAQPVQTKPEPRDTSVPYGVAYSAPAAPLVLHVNAAGKVMRDDKVLVGGDLDNVLYEALAHGKDTEVIVKRVRKAPASAVERVVSRASAIGLSRVSIQQE